MTDQDMRDDSAGHGTHKRRRADDGPGWDHEPLTDQVIHLQGCEVCDAFARHQRADGNLPDFQRAIADRLSRMGERYRAVFNVEALERRASEAQLRAMDAERRLKDLEKRYDGKKRELPSELPTREQAVASTDVSTAESASGRRSQGVQSCGKQSTRSVTPKTRLAKRPSHPLV